MKISREVEIDFLHRDDLAVPTPGRSSLDAEHRPQARLSQAQHGVPASQIQGVGQADRDRRLAFPCRGRTDTRHQDQLPVSSASFARYVERNLGLVVAVGLNVPGLEPDLRGDLLNWTEFGLLRDLDVALVRSAP